MQALTTNILGSHSTAIGQNALFTQNYGTATDGNNTAVGHDAGAEVTSGTANTLIGAFAGDSLTAAFENVAIGVQAQTADTLGRRVVAIGNGALSTQNYTTATNSFNVAVGYEAGKSVTNGIQNTFLGALAADGHQDGQDNVALGYNVGMSATGVNAEIIIGSNVNGGGTNTVRIGTAGGNATLGLDGSDTSWAASSDSRLKTDVATCAVGLDFIKALRPITFKWNAKDAVANTLPQYDADSSDPVYGSGQIQHGFLAQEVKTAIDAHSGIKNGFTMWSEDPNGTQQVAPSALVPMLVKAIQELEARIATLEG